MILKVACLGNPVLREPARPFSAEEIAAPQTQHLIDDMIETMRDHEGVGLAAPQVHVSRRLVILEVDGEQPRYPEAPPIPLQVLVNPEILDPSPDTKEDWEGCLSVPDLRGKVPRHRAIRVRAFDRDGKKLEFTVEDFHARVIQHECDHLDGRVFLDRMTDLTTLTYLSEFVRYATDEDDS